MWSLPVGPCVKDSGLIVKRSRPHHLAAEDEDCMAWHGLALALAGSGWQAPPCSHHCPQVWNKIDLLNSMSFVPPEAIPVCAVSWPLSGMLVLIVLIQKSGSKCPTHNFFDIIFFENYGKSWFGSLHYM